MEYYGIVARENEGAQTQLEGRVVRWLMTPESSGGQYSSVCTVVYDADKRALPAHSHPNGEETVYVISGKGKVKVGDLISDIQPGTVVLFKQDVPHMVWNCGDEPLHMVCFYAPVPEAISYKFYDDFDFPEFKNNISNNKGEMK